MYKNHENDVLIDKIGHKNKLYFNLNTVYDAWIIWTAMYGTVISKEFIFNI